MTEKARTVRHASATVSYEVLNDRDSTCGTICLLASTGRGPKDFLHLAEALIERGFRVILPWPRGTGQSTGQLCLAPYTRPLIFGFSNKVSGTGGFMFRAW